MEKYMMIDGNRVEFTNEKTMLAVILKAGIILPTFCYYSDLSTYDASEGSRRNLYEYAEASQASQDDSGAAAGFPLQRLYCL